jgi:hypothetical protein
MTGKTNTLGGEGPPKSSIDKLIIYAKLYLEFGIAIPLYLG